MSIRGRLLLLTLGLAVPLVLVGLVNLWEAWQAGRKQLNDSIERQAELAATAFEQWLDTQTQTLNTISNLVGSDSEAALKRYINSIVETRPNWLDVQIISSSGEVLLSQSVREGPLPLISIESIRDEVAKRQSLVILSEQFENEDIRLLSLAVPLSDGSFAVARIDGKSVSELFRQLDLPKEHIIAVFDANRRLLFRNHVSPVQMSLDVSNTELLSAVGHKPTSAIEVESPYDGISRLYGLAKVESASCTVAIGVPVDALYAPAKAQYWRQLWIGSLIAVLAGILALLLARGIVKPLRELAGAARAFGNGDLSTRAEISGSGTVRELAETFNQMADRISQREEKLKELDTLKSEFVSGVSHELRTPLTTIKALASVLQQNRITDDERARYIRTVSDECDRQIDFVQNLLDVSRIEAGAFKPSITDVVLDEFLHGIVASEKGAAEARGLGLELEGANGNKVESRSDPAILRRIVLNLIDNSMKYTRPGGKITVSAKQNGRGSEVVVADDGCGIDSADQPYIFDRFFRGHPSEALIGEEEGSEELSRSNRTIGTGLGLFIVKGLAKQINAEVSVESPTMPGGRGSRFVVKLPA
ncbi:MAG: ATP-binding protein [Pyrinomonadaceae bacterium]